MADYEYEAGFMRAHFTISEDGKQAFVMMPGFTVKNVEPQMFVHRVGFPHEGKLLLLEKGWVASDPATGMAISSARDGSANRATAVKAALSVFERVGAETYASKVMTWMAMQAERIAAGAYSADALDFPVEIVASFPPPKASRGD